jgi:hypothetical protein
MSPPKYLFLVGGFCWIVYQHEERLAIEEFFKTLMICHVYFAFTKLMIVPIFFSIVPSAKECAKQYLVGWEGVSQQMERVGIISYRLRICLNLKKEEG